MKKSTDMFAAKKNRLPDTKAIVLMSDHTVHGTAYSSFVVSLRESPHNTTPIPVISAPKEKITTSHPIEKKSFEHLFAASIQGKKDSQIPERAIQIQKTKQSIERMKQQLPTPVSSRNNGFFRNIKNIGISK